MPHSQTAFNDTSKHCTALEYSVEELLAQPCDQLSALDSRRLTNTSPHTVADFLERLSIEERRTVLRLLDEEHVAHILAEMDAEDSAETVEQMRDSRAVKILEDLEPDDAADVVNELEDYDRIRLLDQMKPSSAATVRTLLKYGEHTAGGVMTPNVMRVQANMTVDDAIQYIRSHRDDDSSIHYIYAVDDQERLQGVLSVRSLILANPEQKIQAIMTTSLKGICQPDDDSEAVALEMANLNYLALPVVDTNNRLLGIVTHDDVLDIVQEEATEDLQKLVGAGADESIHDNIWYSVSKRSRWLIVNLFTAFLAAGAIYIFQHQIEQLPLLAVFMPIVASLGGNAGSQTLAVAIRSIALGEIQESEQYKICLGEMVKGLLNGAIIGIIAFILAWLTTEDQLIAVVIFAASIMNMAIAGLAGAFIPIFLKHLHLDPAQSSSIFLTAVTDITGFFVFLSLGSWLLLDKPTP